VTNSVVVFFNKMMKMSVKNCWKRSDQQQNMGKQGSGRKNKIKRKKT